METARFVLLCVSFFCLFASALQISTPQSLPQPRLNTTALGLAFFVLAEMIRR